MTLPPEVAPAIPEAMPSLWGAAFRVGLALVLTAAAASVALRWHQRHRGGRRALEILDRVALTRGASLALVRVAGRNLLLGISPEGVRLLRELGRAGGFERALAEAGAREEVER